MSTTYEDLQAAIGEMATSLTALMSVLDEGVVVPADKPAAKPRTTKRARKAAKPSMKGAYKEIRRLTAAGQHDDAIELALACGWQHVADSVESHRAKHGAVEAVEADETPAERPAPRRAKNVRRGGNRNGNCPIHKTFLRGDGTCGKCQVANRPIAPATNARKARGEASPAAKAAFYPAGNPREADLRTHWQLLADRGHLDVLTAGLERTKEQMGGYRRDGNATMVRVYERRVSDVRRIIKAAR